MPLNLSFTHMMVVAFVALLVLGPDRLPGVARTAGNLYREWKRISGGLQAEVRDVLSEFTEPFAEPISDLIHGPADASAAQLAEATVVAAGATAAAAAATPSSSARAMGTGPVVVPPLSPAIPALGPSTGLMAPGPMFVPTLPELAPAPEPDTFVPFTPGPGGHG